MLVTEDDSQIKNDDFVEFFGIALQLTGHPSPTNRHIPKRQSIEKVKMRNAMI